VAGLSAGDAVQPQLLAQGAAVDTENIRRPHLVAFGVIEHGLQQRLLDFTQHQIVQMRGPMTVEAGEIVNEGPFGVGAQGEILAVGPCRAGNAGPTILPDYHVRSPTASHS
jgi:hypothetical protein